MSFTTFGVLSVKREFHFVLSLVQHSTKRVSKRSFYDNEFWILAGWDLLLLFGPGHLSVSQNRFLYGYLVSDVNMGVCSSKCRRLPVSVTLTEV